MITPTGTKEQATSGNDQQHGRHKQRLSLKGATAAGYAEKGLRVLPVWNTFCGACCCGDPDCKSPGKHPHSLVTRGVLDATTDLTIIAKWWSKAPDANIGIATMGHVVLDIDPRHGGEQSLAEYLMDQKLPDTVTVRTGGGGRHLWFRGNGRKVNGRSGWLPGVDVKAVGGYVLAPPSDHVSGGVYEFEKGHPDKPAIAPEWLANGINRGTGDREKDRFDTRAALAGVAEGKRDETCYKLACKLRAADVPKDIALKVVLEAASNCLPPFDADTARKKVENSYKKYAAGTKEKPKPAPKENGNGKGHELDLLPFMHNDAGNAERLIAVHGDRLRYCHPFRKWLAWTGAYWKPDGTKRAAKLAKQVLVQYYGQAVEKDLKDDIRYAKGSLNSRSVAALLESAECEIFAEPAELDSHPYLLNCLNGMVDLQTGKLRPHDPALLITKVVPFKYDPEAECPRFASFLYRIMGIKEDEDRADRLVAYLQRALGYSLTGVTTEKAVFLLWGGGDNGKTTLLSVVKSLLNDFAALLQIETLMAHRDESTNNQADLADLRGARFVMTSETREGQRLDESKLKRITQGVRGSEIKTCRKYENPISFIETHKLWIDANHRPIVRGTDNAIWNRLHLIPFTVAIPKDEQVRDYADVLLKEADGILAWAVAGAVEWFRDGLGKPPDVEKAGKLWRSESDSFGDFIHDSCVMGQDEEFRVKGADLRETYEKWCESVGEKRLLSRQEFNERLTASGCTQKALRFDDITGPKVARGWSGIRLKKEGEGITENGL